MNRREFLRRTVPPVALAAGGTFVPEFGRWFRRLGGLWARDPVLIPHWETVTTSSAGVERVWRKVQGELLTGYNLEVDEWAREYVTLPKREIWKGVGAGYGSGLSFGITVPI